MVYYRRRPLTQPRQLMLNVFLVTTATMRCRERLRVSLSLGSLGKIQTFPDHLLWYHTSMNIDQIAPEALKLPIRERALLAASLWESIEDPFEISTDFDDEAALILAEERDQEIESGRVKALSHGELMQRLRQ